MSIPNCPTHGVPMKVSKFGGFYCTQQAGEDENGQPEYCREKVRAPKPSSIPGTVPAATLLKTDHDVLLAACLHFAGETFKGGGPEMAEEAIALAIKTYSALKAVA